ncbi:MAG TPA: Na+/H+ antiporter subunit E [Synergistaceae bacterium]|nr:Na+/H+ antiporter subunit E [Synergistaceae bacterium]HPJ25804.1 Na+/H+ antiporter subunit E [Synergistaceae bacterium]HPQ37688.1 Na+/H+ antiporter subunit E [Synergistaceae bacterium]
MRICRKNFLLFFALFGLWILLTGRKDIPFLCLGALVSLLILKLVWNIFFLGFEDPRSPNLCRDIHFSRLFLFLPLFLVDLIVATWKVALLALCPRMKISPGIYRIDSTLKDKTLLVFLANQITLTPGTLTLDGDPATHALYIHVLDTAELSREALQNQVTQLEDRLRRVVQ